MFLLSHNSSFLTLLFESLLKLGLVLKYKYSCFININNSCHTVRSSITSLFMFLFVWFFFYLNNPSIITTVVYSCANFLYLCFQFHPGLYVLIMCFSIPFFSFNLLHEADFLIHFFHILFMDPYKLGVLFCSQAVLTQMLFVCGDLICFSSPFFLKLLILLFKVA